jgi:hypothetical protein
MISTPVVVQPAAPDNASPLPAVPSRSVPSTPTAYGSAVGAGLQKAAPFLQDDGEGDGTLRERPRPTQSMQDRYTTRAERKRMRSRPEDD